MCKATIIDPGKVNLVEKVVIGHQPVSDKTLYECNALDIAILTYKVKLNL